MMNLLRPSSIVKVGHHLISKHRTKSTAPKIDPSFLKNLIERIDNEKSYQDVHVDQFCTPNDAEDHRKKIQTIISIYENMKYNLEDVPSTLNVEDIQLICQLPTVSDIRRFIKKLSKKESDQLLKKELKLLGKSDKIHQEKSLQNENRCGLFDENGHLIYGLWHNCLFTRVNEKFKRLLLDKYRLAETFGQNLHIDFSYCQHLTYHQSTHVAHDIVNVINLNYRQSSEPFNIIFSGVDYHHHLWKLLSTNFPNLTDSVRHTSENYLNFIPERQEIAYFTTLEKENIVEFNPNLNYVLPALSEKDVQQNFLIPSLKKLNVPRYGVPIDQYVLWKHGSKRLSLKTKFQILRNLRDGKDWKAIIERNVDAKKLKDKDITRMEDRKRLMRMKKTHQS